MLVRIRVRPGGRHVSPTPSRGCRDHLRVTLGAGIVAGERDAIEAALGFGAPSTEPPPPRSPRRRSPPVTVADPTRLPDLSIEVAGPAALAQEIGRALADGVAPGEAAIAGLVDVVPVTFVQADFGAPSTFPRPPSPRRRPSDRGGARLVRRGSRLQRHRDGRAGARRDDDLAIVAPCAALRRGDHPP